jgi:hypothetical protein
MTRKIIILFRESAMCESVVKRNNYRAHFFKYFEFIDYSFLILSQYFSMNHIKRKNVVKRLNHS